MFTRAFWKGAGERAISTAAQVAILTIGADMFNVIAVDWLTVAGFAAGGALLTILKALAAGAKDGNPSIVNAEVTIPDGPGKRRAEVASDILD